MKRIVLRNAVPEDWPAIVRLHTRQQAEQGSSYELPYLFGPQIAVALVGVDEQGTIHNCVYVERVAELRFVGCDAKATAFSQREITGLAYLLKLQGYRWLECFVPQKLKRYIEKPLRRAGFENKESELAYFTKDLRGNE